ncbi:MAG: glycosyltransferase family 4 protein [Gemmatimonadota bacterium]|nr:glycosyltransferase family 4 protein [Gemmatimonadota bacterium]
MRGENRRLNILVVNWQDAANPNAGGAEIHLHEIFGRLAAWGHTVTLLVSGWPGGPEHDEADGMEITRVGSRYTYPVHARRAFRRLARRPFDVIVEDINKIPLFTTRWSETPVVALVPHLFGSTAFQQESVPIATAVWLAERLMPKLYRDVPFEVISESTADDLVRRGFRRDHITVSYPGIDHAICTPHPAGPGVGRASEPVIAYVGRLQRYKGLECVLRAVAVLHGEGRPVRFVIAGKGEDRARLERLTAELGIEALVDFRGYISEAAKIELLRSSWANVYPSPKEGWGITNIEAAACGTPSLASDAPGLRESVIEGETGFLIPHGDIGAWAERLRLLCESPDRVAKMGEPAIRHAARFTWDETARQTEALLLTAA